MADDLKTKSVPGIFRLGIKQWIFHGLNGFSFLIFARSLNPFEDAVGSSTLAAISCFISWLFLFVSEARLQKIFHNTWHDHFKNNFIFITASVMMLLILLIISGFIGNITFWLHLLLLTGLSVSSYSLIVLFLLLDRDHLFSELRALLNESPAPELQNG
jgi:uncharacterized membrane protein